VKKREEAMKKQVIISITPFSLIGLYRTVCQMRNQFKKKKSVHHKNQFW